MTSENEKNPVGNKKVIYHIVVVGFHHKKGCQIEYAFPPFTEGHPDDNSAVPEEWKYLAHLALPDGAHNYTEDTIYFHLPPRKDMPDKTVYCVSCFRQISSNLLKNKEDHVTRGTVQKSVVVLSKVPLYGLLHAKLQLITHAYFEEKDFSQNHILKELYDHINISLSSSDESQQFLGLSVRSLVFMFKHKIVMLFKLILLEKCVIFHCSPVLKLVESILSLLSLFPRMIEVGLNECADINTARQESGELDLSQHKAEPFSNESNGGVDAKYDRTKDEQNSDIVHFYPTGNNDLNVLEPEQVIADDDTFADGFDNARLEMSLDSPVKQAISMSARNPSGRKSYTENENCKTSLDVDEFGFPLSVFTEGHICFPYVALQQYDLLAENVCNGFVAGATNVLFKTRQNLSDVVIDLENAELIFHNPELRKLLHLTSADLRFADHVVSNVMEKGNEDIFLDATAWEGGDEWIRGLFSEYLNGLLSASLKDVSNPDAQDYGEPFLSAWKQTKNFQIWKNGNHTLSHPKDSCHPFHGQFSMSDMKLRLHHNLQSSEKGRKFEGAMVNANQAVASTGRYVGSAVMSAKSSLSSWFSSKLSNTQN